MCNNNYGNWRGDTVKKDYTKYLEIIDKYINVDWNFTGVFEKIIDEIISEYNKELPHDETTL